MVLNVGWVVSIPAYGDDPGEMSELLEEFGVLGEQRLGESADRDNGTVEDDEDADDDGDVDDGRGSLA